MSTAGDWDEATARTVGAAFVKFDGGSKGYLTRHELRCAHIALLGHPPSLVELDALIPKQRQSALGEITSPLPSSQSSSAACAGIGLPQLCEYMARKLALQEPDEVVRRAFRAFDTTAKGYVNFSDFQAAVATFAAGLPQQTVELCFSQLDADGDGRVSFRDFATMMSTLRPDGRAAGLVAPAAARFAGGAPRTTQPLATM